MVFPAVTMEGILLSESGSNDDDGAAKGLQSRSVGSVFCFGRFGRGSAYAPVLILRVRVEGTVILANSGALLSL
jgi:hypothetical protein